MAEAPLLPWAPARRLRHLDGVILQNFDVSAPLTFPDASRSFCYTLDWQRDREDPCAWHPYYRSEQVTGDMLLLWDSITPPSPSTLSSLSLPTKVASGTAPLVPTAAAYPEHRPDIQSVRLRVFCCTTPPQTRCTASTPGLETAPPPTASYPGLRCCRSACAYRDDAAVRAAADAVSTLGYSSKGPVSNTMPPSQTQAEEDGQGGLTGGVSALAGIAEDGEEEAAESVGAGQHSTARMGSDSSAQQHAEANVADEERTGSGGGAGDAAAQNPQWVEGYSLAAVPDGKAGECDARSESTGHELPAAAEPSSQASAGHRSEHHKQPIADGACADGANRPHGVGATTGDVKHTAGRDHHLPEGELSLHGGGPGQPAGDAPGDKVTSSRSSPPRHDLCDGAEEREPEQVVHELVRRALAVVLAEEGAQPSRSSAQSQPIGDAPGEVVIPSKSSPPTQNLCDGAQEREPEQVVRELVRRALAVVVAEEGAQPSRNSAQSQAQASMPSRSFGTPASPPAAAGGSASVQEEQMELQQQERQQQQQQQQQVPQNAWQQQQEQQQQQRQQQQQQQQQQQRQEQQTQSVPSAASTSPPVNATMTASGKPKGAPARHQHQCGKFLLMELQFELHGLVPAGPQLACFQPNTVMLRLSSGELCVVPEGANVIVWPEGAPEPETERDAHTIGQQGSRLQHQHQQQQLQQQQGQGLPVQGQQQPQQQQLEQEPCAELAELLGTRPSPQPYTTTLSAHRPPGGPSFPGHSSISTSLQSQPAHDGPTRLAAGGSEASTCAAHDAGFYAPCMVWPLFPPDRPGTAPPSLLSAQQRHSTSSPYLFEPGACQGYDLPLDSTTLPPPPIRRALYSQQQEQQLANITKQGPQPCMNQPHPPQHPQATHAQNNNMHMPPPRPPTPPATTPSYAHSHHTHPCLSQPYPLNGLNFPLPGSHIHAPHPDSSTPTTTSTTPTQGNLLFPSNPSPSVSYTAPSSPSLLRSAQHLYKSSSNSSRARTSYEAAQAAAAAASAAAATRNSAASSTALGGLAGPVRARDRRRHKSFSDSLNSSASPPPYLVSAAPLNRGISSSGSSSRAGHHHPPAASGRSGSEAWLNRDRHSGSGAALKAPQVLQQGPSAAAAAAAAAVLTKRYDVLDVKAGIRRLEAHTQRLAATQARRERARERLHQLLQNQGGCARQLQELQAQAVNLCKEERRADMAAQALQAGRMAEEEMHSALCKRLDSLRSASNTLQGHKRQHAASVADMRGPSGMGQQLQRLHSELAYACNTLVAGIAGLYALGPLPPPPSPHSRVRKDTSHRSAPAAARSAAAPAVPAISPAPQSPTKPAAVRTHAIHTQPRLTPINPAEPPSQAIIGTATFAPQMANGNAAVVTGGGSSAPRTNSSHGGHSCDASSSAVAGDLAAAASGQIDSHAPWSPRPSHLYQHQSQHQHQQHSLAPIPQQQFQQQPPGGLLPQQTSPGSPTQHPQQQQRQQQQFPQEPSQDPPQQQAQRSHSGHMRSFSDSSSLNAVFSALSPNPPPPSPGHRYSHSFGGHQSQPGAAGKEGSLGGKSRRGVAGRAGMGGWSWSSRAHSTRPQQQLPLEALLEASWWAKGASADNAEEDDIVEGASSGGVGGSNSSVSSSADSNTLSEVIHSVLEQQTPSSHTSATDLSSMDPSTGTAPSSRELPAAENAVASSHAHSSQTQGASARPEAAGSSGKPGLKHAAGGTVVPALAGHPAQRRAPEVPSSIKHSPSHPTASGSMPQGLNGRHPANTPPPLAVLGIVLSPNLSQRCMDGMLGWEGTYDEEQRVAAALGCVAHMVDRIATYCEVPLRYPLQPMLSTSSIIDPYPPLLNARDQRSGSGLGNYLRQIGANALGLAWPSALLGRHQPQSQSDDAVVYGGGRWGPASVHWKGANVLPLHYDSRDRMRFAVAIYFLNKDVEQLLQAHGLSSAGPMQLLQNLYTLALVAASGT